MTINAKQDAQVGKMAAKAANLQAFVQEVWLAPDLETKRMKACQMAEHFEVGGKEKFIDSIMTAPNAKTVDNIAKNAFLKGEGMSTKRF